MSRPSEVICEVAQTGLAVLAVATTAVRSRTFGDDYHPKPGAKCSCCTAVSALTIAEAKRVGSCPVVGGKSVTGTKALFWSRPILRCCHARLKANTDEGWNMSRSSRLACSYLSLGGNSKVCGVAGGRE